MPAFAGITTFYDNITLYQLSLRYNPGLMVYCIFFRYILSIREHIFIQLEYMATKKPRKKKKLQPRLPLEAALKLRNHPVASQKGLKKYDRKLKKEQTRKLVIQDLIDNSG
jgi:hypothetical protein